MNSRIVELHTYLQNWNISPVWALLSIMTLDANRIVSIVEIVVYVPALVLSLIVCNRHGFSRSSGYVNPFVHV